MMEMRSERHFIQVIWLGGHDLEEYISDFASIHYFLQKCNIYQRNRSDAVNYFYNLEARPLRKWKIEDLVFTRSSIFSCDTSPVNTTQVLIHIDQKLRLVLGVSSVYLFQFVADVAFRHCSIRYRTFLESRCSLYIEYGQTLRGSACPHLRAPLIHLKYHPKQANELLHEPHTASF